MSIVFNLKKALQTIKEAMAGKRNVYKDALEWWRIDEIEAGDPKWLEWVAGNPEKGVQPNSSLINALANARNDYYKRKLRFCARYGCTKQEVDTFYKMWIGYHPNEGMRALHIGPYTATGGAWDVTEELLQNSKNKSLTPENLMALAETIEIPELPPGFDIKDAANKKHPLKLAYDKAVRTKRQVLEVRADLLNKFNYFVKTYNRIKRSDMNRSVTTYLERLLKSVGVVFTEDDLGVVIKSFPPDKVRQLEGKVMGQINTKFNSINPNTPEGQELEQKNILLGKGSFLTLNHRGINKLLQKAAQDGNWQDLYEQAVQIVAQANNKTIEEARALVAQDDSFSRMFIEQLQNIQDQLKKAGDFRGDFLNIALDKKPKKPPKVGAQRTSTNRFSKAQWSVVEFNADILSTVIQLGTDDPQQVADALNASRKVHKSIAKGKYNAELVKNWLDAIKAEDHKIQRLKRKKSNRTYQEIYESTRKEIESMEHSEAIRDTGVSDLAIAFKNATLSYLKTPLEYIDPKTNAKFQLTEVPNMFSKDGDSDAPVTSKRMTELRMEREKVTTEKERMKVLKEEIEKEIGVIEGGMESNEEKMDITEIKQSKMDEQEPDEEEVATDAADAATMEGAEGTEVPSEAQPADVSGMPDFDVTEIPQEKDPADPNGTPPTPPPTPPTPPSAGVAEIPQEVEEEPMPEQPVQPKKLNLKDLVGNTLQSLIIMARDLDSQGKEKAAEEIHQIIRKYQGRI